MRGFKLVREDYVHNDFKYQEGLNVDTLPFRTRGTCVAGGLYFFTDIKDVVNWLDYGVYLYQVEVPKGRRFVKDPDGDKYRSKYLILKNRFDLREVATWEYLIEQGTDIHAFNDEALRWTATNGHFEVFKFLVEKGADIHAYDEVALRRAAKNGHLDIVKCLVSLGADIHAGDEYALRWAAEKGHLDIVRYLVENGADIHAANDGALRRAAYHGHLEVVKYLVEKDADIRADNREALRNAFFMGHTEIFEYLKSFGIYL